MHQQKNKILSTGPIEWCQSLYYTCTLVNKQVYLETGTTRQLPSNVRLAAITLTLTQPHRNIRTQHVDLLENITHCFQSSTSSVTFTI